MAKVGLDTATHAGRIVPMHTKKQCDREMNAGAKSARVLVQRRPLQLQTIPWIAIGYGAFVSIAALFAGTATIVGLPAGAVVAALGIPLGTVASFFLWKVDQQRWSSKRVCF